MCTALTRLCGCLQLYTFSCTVCSASDTLSPRFLESIFSRFVLFLSWALYTFLSWALNTFLSWALYMSLSWALYMECSSPSSGTDALPLWTPSGQTLWHFFSQKTCNVFNSVLLSSCTLSLLFI